MQMLSWGVVKANGLSGMASGGVGVLGGGKMEC